MNVSLSKKENGMAELLFEVKDTGCGIPRHELGYIFEDFRQVSLPAFRKRGGTGLGLSICKRLVQMMGGEIGVESTEGQGSQFWFSLSCGIGTQPEAVAAPPADLSALRLLAIDDEPVNRRIYAELFNAWGIEPDIADSAEQGLQMMKDAYKQGYAYDIVIVDYVLPGLNGIELAGHIHRDHTISDTLLVMLTSSARIGDARMVSDAGFAAYLTKPFRAADLRDTLATLWSRSKSGKEQAEPLMTRHRLQEQKHQRREHFANRFDAAVLLVEDNHVNQMVAAAMLKKMGCVVDLAGDGLEGIRQAVFRRYDIIFMDCQMPELDGYEATMELRAREKNEKELPKTIIAMTAHAMSGDREKCLDAGMDDYLTKPLKEEELFAMLEKWLPEHCHRPVPEPEKAQAASS
jgi:CheY-like chemotaxis protein